MRIESDVMLETLDCFLFFSIYSILININFFTSLGTYNNMLLPITFFFLN